MSKIPKDILSLIKADPYYKICARKNTTCSGRITFEHAFIYAGRQIQERWAIIPLCWHHHLGDGLNKRMNEYIAVNRATKEELNKYPRKNWNQYKSFPKSPSQTDV